MFPLVNSCFGSGARGQSLSIAKKEKGRLSKIKGEKKATPKTNSYGGKKRGEVQFSSPTVLLEDWEGGKKRKSPMGEGRERRPFGPKKYTKKKKKRGGGGRKLPISRRSLKEFAGLIKESISFTEKKRGERGGRDESINSGMPGKKRGGGGGKNPSDLGP